MVNMTKTICVQKLEQRRNNRIQYKANKKDTQRTGFEPVRVTPSDFESDASAIASHISPVDGA